MGSERAAFEYAKQMANGRVVVPIPVIENAIRECKYESPFAREQAEQQVRNLFRVL